MEPLAAQAFQIEPGGILMLGLGAGGGAQLAGFAYIGIGSASAGGDGVQGRFGRGQPIGSSSAGGVCRLRSGRQASQIGGNGAGAGGKAGAFLLGGFAATAKFAALARTGCDTALPITLFRLNRGAAAGSGVGIAAGGVHGGARGGQRGAGGVVPGSGSGQRRRQAGECIGRRHGRARRFGFGRQPRAVGLGLGSGSLQAGFLAGGAGRRGFGLRQPAARFRQQPRRRVAGLTGGALGRGNAGGSGFSVAQNRARLFNCAGSGLTLGLEFSSAATGAQAGGGGIGAATRINQPIPAPQFAVAAHQPLAGLQRGQQRRIRRGINNAGLRQPARQFGRCLHLAGQRHNARRQCRIVSSHTAGKAARRGGAGGARFHVFAQRGSQRSFISGSNDQLIGNARTLPLISRQPAGQSLGFGLQAGQRGAGGGQRRGGSAACGF